MTATATARCAWRAAIDAVLADGEWHDVDKVIAAGAAVVPPGVAYREGERLRQNDRIRRGSGAGDRRNGTYEDSVATGRRSKARHVLGVMRRRGQVEVDGDRVRAVRG